MKIAFKDSCNVFLSSRLFVIGQSCSVMNKMMNLFQDNVNTYNKPI